MIDSTHLLKHVIRPTLTDLDFWSPAAERLVLGTACQESHCGEYLVQLGIEVGAGGLGIYQCEAATHEDIWDNFLAFHTKLAEKITDILGVGNNGERALIGNLFYATAICRVHYLRVPLALPDDLPGQAWYWKKFYNTMEGKGTVTEYMNNWQRYVPQGVV